MKRGDLKLLTLFLFVVALCIVGLIDELQHPGVCTCKLPGDKKWRPRAEVHEPRAFGW